MRTKKILKLRKLVRQSNKEHPRLHAYLYIDQIHKKIMSLSDFEMEIKPLSFREYECLCVLKDRIEEKKFRDWAEQKLEELNAKCFN